MDEWVKKTPDDAPELRTSPIPVIAEWTDRSGQNTVVLYEEGTVGGEGVYPVELLPHVEGAWLAYQKARML